jgi:CheY-like chemotaxis protein
LEDDFDPVATSLDPDSAVEDFQRHHPEVLILAFKDLKKAGDFCLGLFRLGSNNPPQPHRTVLLCSKDGVKHAYEMCRRGLFDDYVLFWPVTYDATRLQMSVYGQLDELRAVPDERGLAATCAKQAQRLMELESLLSEQLTRGREHIASTSRAVAGAEHDIGRALDNLSARLVNTGSRSMDKAPIVGLAEMAVELERCRSEAVLPHLHKVSASLGPLTEWAGSVQQAVEPYLDSARALNALAAQVHPMVLVVDDDEFQRKLTARILESEGYQLKFAASGGEAMSVLCRTRPDVILMDFLMPDMDGIEVTKRIKSEPNFAAIPVIMITGHSDRDIVLTSLELGVVDFIVKPFDRSALVKKLTRVLNVSATVNRN